MPMLLARFALYAARGHGAAIDDDATHLCSLGAQQPPVQAQRNEQTCSKEFCKTHLGTVHSLFCFRLEKLCTVPLRPQICQAFLGELLSESPA